MAQPENESAETLTRNEATALGRFLNIVFNNANLYGGAHPSTLKSVDTFVAKLVECLRKAPMVALMRTGGSLYLEGWCVDSVMNTGRIVTQLDRTGMESVCFVPGITASEVAAFFRVLGESETLRTVDAMAETLAAEGVATVKLNYVVYQKVTTDEKIVGKDAFPENGAAEPREEAAVADSQPRDLDSIFTLEDTTTKPEDVSRSVGAGVDGTAAGVLEQLRELAGKAASEEQTATGASVDDMMTAVCKLRSDLREGLAVQKEMGKVITEESALLEESDKLTYRTIVDIVRKEYAAGNLTVRRLGQIIRRIVPDTWDLRRMLPLLKQGLSAEGMSPSEFLALLKELGSELQSDALGEVLERAGEEIGLSASDIIAELKENPEEAARLIVLAAEIRRGTGSDDSGLSDLLTKYIEDASGKMALVSGQAQPGGGAAVLEKIAARVEQQLLEKLRTQGVSSEVLRQVEARLAERFPKTMGELKSHWVAEAIAKDSGDVRTALSGILSVVAANSEELDMMRKPLQEALKAKGYSEPEIDDICSRLASMTPPKARRLPTGVMRAGNTVYFLQREIRQNRRYHTPFSCILVTISGCRDRNGWRRASDEEVVEAIPRVCAVVQEMLRDVDIVGSLDAGDQPVPFVILPMTEMAGADIVTTRLRERLRDELGRSPREIVPVATVSCTCFDSLITPDLKSFLQLVKMRHRDEAAGSREQGAASG